MKGRQFQKGTPEKEPFGREPSGRELSGKEFSCGGNFLRKHVRLIFFLYLLVVIKVIIFKYPLDQLRAIAATWEKEVILEGLDTANFTLFKTIRMYIDYSYKLNSFENLAGNIVVFVPFGFLFPYVISRGRNFFIMLLHAFLLVLGIEVFQLFSAFGAFDVDDILLNCFGAVLGYMAYLVFETMKKWRRNKKRRG